MSNPQTPKPSAVWPLRRVFVTRNELQRSNAFLVLTTVLMVIGWWTQGAAETVDVSDAVRSAGVNADASTIVVKRLSDGQTWLSNPERAQQRFSPASTSKIPHTLIALETGVAQPDTVFVWKKVVTWNQDWNRDHTLTTAFRQSVVWVFQEIVQIAGHQTMADWMNRFDYGNATIGATDHLTTYWLDGTLRISAEEQVAFVSRFVREQLPISERTHAVARVIMFNERGDNWSLYAKSGWRHGEDIMDIGWYVGWVHCAKDTYVFALNLDMPDGSYRTFRQSAATSVLNDIGAFDCR